MAYKIEFSDRADEEIDDIKSHMTNTAGQKFVADVYEYAHMISINPKVGRKIIGSPYRRIVLKKKHSIYYKQEGQTIIISSVYDNRQDPDNLNL